MANKRFDWTGIYAVIDKIPKGYWMSYGDVCAAAGLKRSAAMAIGMAFARASSVPKNIHRVLRNDGSIPTSWKGEIGNADDCKALLEQEGLTFDQWGRANSLRRFTKTVSV